MVFTNKSYGVATPADKFAQATKKRPVLYFGLPFLLTVVVGSFALSELTATKYNVHDNRTRAMTKEEGLKLSSKSRRKLDLQEEYWRLQAQDTDDDDWEIKRVDAQAAPGVTTSPTATAASASARAGAGAGAK